MTVQETTEFEEIIVEVGDIPVTVLRSGQGDPLLVLHDELGFPGWMTWNRAMAHHRQLIMPLQPGFGRTPRVDWIATFRDLAAFYGRLLREQRLAPIDVIGFSAGGYIAAEMAAACPDVFSHLVLVAPLGIKPIEGEILDIIAMTARSHVAATVSNVDAPEFGEIYGGEMTSEQFELFECARAETTRLGWEPFLHDPSLPHLLEGIGSLPSLLIWGSDDLVLPRGGFDAYRAALPEPVVEEMSGCGHRPEIEDPDRFIAVVSRFLTGAP